LRGGTTSEEHDEWLREQWNSVVGKNDLVYVLGDISMDTEGLKKLKRFKAQKHLILGNHDLETAQKYLEYFSVVKGVVSYKGIFWMTHTPIHPQELYGRINLHGHTHANNILGPDGQPDPNYINCCVEATYGVPQSLDDLRAKWEPIVLERKKALRGEGPG
jgi:calcineurin-like phosphoesterase family protein